MVQYVSRGRTGESRVGSAFPSSLKILGTPILAFTPHWLSLVPRQLGDPVFYGHVAALPKLRCLSEAEGETGYGIGYCSLSQRDNPGLRNGEIPGFEVCPDVIFSSLSIFNIPNIPTTRLGQNL